MKTFRFAAIVLSAFTTLTAGLSAQPSAPPVRGSSRPIWEEEASSPSRSRFHRATRNAETFGMNRMAGRAVRSSRGEELSTITDFLVDPQSGRVEFAMLPSGAGAKGMTYRILPISAFTGATQDALVINLDRAQWDRVGTMEEWQLKDRVTIDVDHQQRLSRQLGLPQSAIYDRPGPAELVRATTLRGQPIRAGNGQVGRIDDVVVDVTRREFAAVLTTDRAFAGAELRFVVPFQQLGTRESGTWISHLTRDDFVDREAQSAPPPAPRGYDRSRDRGYLGGSTQPYPVPDRRGETESAAAEVRQSFDRSWARGRVDVAIEGQRIVLRGLVETEQERAELEHSATDIARGVRIDNQIAVRRR